MNATPASIPAKPSVAVAVYARDPARKLLLEALLRDGGYPPAQDGEHADVLVVDGAAAHPDHAAVLRLGDDGDWDTLPPDAAAEQLGAAIAALAAGLSVRVRSAPAGGFAAAPEPQLLLTPREVEILGALSEGLSNKATARKLEISQHTVKFHVESLFRKLGVRSRAQAVVKGLGLLSRSRLDV
jgi:DNA-binding NarL/FixJ family response regulator